MRSANLEPLRLERSESVSRKDFRARAEQLPRAYRIPVQAPRAYRIPGGAGAEAPHHVQNEFFKISQVGFYAGLHVNSGLSRIPLAFSVWLAVFPAFT